MADVGTTNRSFRLTINWHSFPAMVRRFAAPGTESVMNEVAKEFDKLATIAEGEDSEYVIVKRSDALAMGIDFAGQKESK